MNPHKVDPREIKDLVKRLIEVFWRATSVFFSATLIEKPFDPFSSVYHEEGSVFQSSRIGLMTKIFDDEKMLKDSFHSKTRNMIRKAKKSNIETYIHLNSIDEIQKIHKENMEAIGAPVKPDSFFDWLKTIPKGIECYNALYEGEIIAGLILLRQKSTVEYFMPVIKKEFRSFAPLDLLIFKAMKDQARSGVLYWNWGGTTLPGQEGVYRFKKRFGARESNYYYHTRTSAETLKKLGAADLKKEYPYYFVVPFDQLPAGGDFYEEDIL